MDRDRELKWLAFSLYPISFFLYSPFNQKNILFSTKKLAYFQQKKLDGLSRHSVQERHAIRFHERFWLGHLTATSCMYPFQGLILQLLKNSYNFYHETSNLWIKSIFEEFVFHGFSNISEYRRLLIGRVYGVQYLYITEHAVENIAYTSFNWSLLLSYLWNWSFLRNFFVKTKQIF